MAIRAASFEDSDFYSDLSLVDDPYPYIEFLRSRGPVVRLAHHGVVAITGFEEALQVYADQEHFSSINAITGPFPPLPFEPRSDDISDQLHQWRDRLPMGGHLATQDPPDHSRLRSLLNRLFTPARMKANDSYIAQLSRQLIDEFATAGEVEIVRGYGVPFAGLVIADLLGVPECDRALLRSRLTGALPSVGGDEAAVQNPHEFIEQQFTAYIEERRPAPRGDVLSDLANACFTDGTAPTVAQVVQVAAVLFSAGQDTTARLLGTVMERIAETPDLQDALRADRGMIPDFIEECLRLEGAVKTTHRMVRKPTSIGGIELTPGTTVAILTGGVNRDPLRFEEPQQFRIARPRNKEHLSFGRGAHTCPGAQLARTETRISLELLLDRMLDIRISSRHHGPPGSRRLHHEPTYILRGLRELHLEFTPAG